MDLLVSNPPYIRRGDIEGLSEEVKGHDPHTALDGGVDGLDYYHALAGAMGKWLRPGGHIAVKNEDDQGPEVHDIFAGAGASDIEIIKDYSDRDRVVTARVGASDADREDG